MDDEAGLLAGLRVVDCSSGSAGPFATGLLADHGADVVWIEPPAGDPYRGILEAYPAWNRGKRSVTLDLSRDTDRDRLLQLLAGADVLVESWEIPPPGLTHEEIHAACPGLVHTSITTRGTGLAAAPGLARDALVEADLGVMAEAWGHRDGPIYPGVHFAGMGAGYLAVIGALAALLQRTRDGVGRFVETSLRDGVLAFMNMYWVLTDPPLPSIGRSDTRTTRRRVIGVFPCADGKRISIHTGAAGAHARLMKALGLDDRVRPTANPVEANEPLSEEEGAFLADALPRVLATRTREEWLESLLAADICVMAVLEPGEAFDDPQVRHNDLIVRVEDPDLGPVDQVGAPLHVRGHRHRIRRGAPRAGSTPADAVWPDEPSPWICEPRESFAAVSARAPLEGIRVLDYGAYVAGPYGPRLLADLGADVLKIESPAGDQMRPTVQPFHLAQRGKRSVCLNLKDSRDQEVNRQLVASADVIAHNMRPGAADRVGIGEAQVREVNPAAVYAFAPGWGSTGPSCTRQGFAPLFSGVAGLQTLAGGEGNPPAFTIGNEDNANGLLGAAGMLMALLHRTRTGAGVYLENPQIDATLAMTAQVMRTADGGLVPFRRLDHDQQGLDATDRLYRTRDGWICVSALLDAEFAALARALQADALARDARFASVAARRRHSADLTAELEKRFAGLTTAAVAERLDTAQVPYAIPRENGAAAVLHDPAEQARGRVATDDHPRLGKVWSIATLLRVADSRMPRTRRPPELGEHTDEVLASLPATIGPRP